MESQKKNKVTRAPLEGLGRLFEQGDILKVKTCRDFMAY
jgi:hypothetical protein